MQTESRTQALITIEENQIRVTTSDGVTAGPINPATLSIPGNPHLVVRINGVQAYGRTLVLPSDIIEIEVSDGAAERLAAVDIEKEGMSAFLTIRYGPGVHRSLRAVDAAPYVVLSVVETETPYTVFTIAEIGSILAERGLGVPIEWGEVQTFLVAGRSGSCICAKGVPPVEGSPERYEVTVEDGSEDIQLLGIVPVHPVTTVRRGTLIGLRLAAEEGTPGRTVLGASVEPKPFRRPLPRLGNGVTEDTEGNLVSTRGGRVVHLGNLIDVAETLELSGPVQVTQGHIVFDGDVLVRGDVTEGVVITAGGHVFVSGIVSNAIITANGSVTVGGGVFASTINAGTRTQWVDEVGTMLRRIGADFADFVQSVERMLGKLLVRGSAMNPGRIASRALEERAAGTVGWSDEVRQWTENHQEALGVALANPLLNLANALSPHRLSITRDVAEWHRVSLQIQKILESLPPGSQQSADIQIKNGQASTFVASGSIMSTGQGFYRCTMTAGNTIRALAMSGVILGCHAVSGQLVEAREIGSFAETGTTVEVRAEGGTVKAGKIHPGTLLQYHSWRHKVAREMINAKWP